LVIVLKLGATVLRMLLASEWTWHACITNLSCVRG